MEEEKVFSLSVWEAEVRLRVLGTLLMGCTEDIADFDIKDMRGLGLFIMNIANELGEWNTEARK